jgi:hypothetical protein
MMGATTNPVCPEGWQVQIGGTPPTSNTTDISFDLWNGPLGTGRNPAQEIADGWQFGLIAHVYYGLPGDGGDLNVVTQIIAQGYPQLVVYGPGIPTQPPHVFVSLPYWFRFLPGIVSSPAPPDPPPAPPPLPVLSSSDPTWGQVIPQSFGTRRINGVPIWLGKVGTDSSVDFAVAFGYTARPATDIHLVQLTRLWANGILIFDALTPGAPVAQSGITVTFYPGRADAQPDPTIKSAMGDSTPAFRDMFYAVIKGFVLSSNDSSVPHIRAELQDAPAYVSPALTPFTLLSPAASISTHGLVVDWNRGVIYGVASPAALPHVLSEFDLASGEEIRRVEIDGSVLTAANPPTSPPGQFGILFTDFWTVYDSFNQLEHTQSGASLTNSVRIVTMNYTTGTLVASIGNCSNATSSGFIGGLPSVVFSSCADLIRFRAWNETIHGLMLGSIVSNELNILTYRKTVQVAGPQNPVVHDRAGIYAPGDSISLGFENSYAAGGTVACVCAYPVIERPELIAKYRVDSLNTQDAVMLYGLGTQLMVLHAGLSSPDGTNVGWVTSVPAFPILETAGLTITNIFIEPTTGSIMVAAEVVGTGILYKLAPIWTQTANGVAMTGVTQIYATPLNNWNSFPLQKNLKNQRMDSGTFSYPSSGGIAIVSLATGTVIYSQFLSGTTDEYAFDSIFQRAYLPVGPGSPGPLTKAELSTGTTTNVLVTDFLKWCALRLGYGSTDITVPVPIADTVIGGNITSPVTVRTAMATAAAIFGIAAVELGGKIQFVKPNQGDAAVLQAVFSNEDLSSMQEGQPASLATTVLAANELPADVQLTFLDPANDYNNNTQTYRRVRFPFQTAKAAGVAKFAMPLVVNGEDALQLAAGLVLASYGQGTAYAYRLPHRYINLLPGDVIGFLGKDKVTIEELAQIEEISYNGDWSLSMKGKRWSLSDTLVISADAPAGRQVSQVRAASDSVSFAFDIPYIDPVTDVVPGAAAVYTAAGSLGQSWWSAAQLSRSLDGVMTTLYETNAQLPWGTVAEKLPATEANGTTFQTDNDTVLTVSGRSLTSNLFVSVTAEQCRAGYNMALIGGTGRWELVFFQNVTIVSSKVVKLSGILRGRRGTNQACDAHVAGDTFVLIKTNNVKTLLREDNLNLDRRGKIISYYATGINTLRPPLPESFTFIGATAKPWTVRRIRATYGPEINAVNATSYSNECGQGNRLSLIEVLGSYHTDNVGVDGGLAPLPTLGNVDYAPAKLIDGVASSGAANATNFFTGQTTVQITFDFHNSGFPQIIDEFTWEQSNNTNVGTYTWEASNDQITWTSLATGLNLPGASGIGVHAYSNVVGYWFYRLRQTSGTTSSSPWLKEITFKTMASVATNDILITWLRRDRLKPSTRWITDDLPMSEAAELYSVNVYDPAGGLARTLPLTRTRRAVYSAANQVTDGFTPPLANVTVRIAQLGAGNTIDDEVGFADTKTVGVT